MTTADLKTKGTRRFVSTVIEDKVDAAGRHHRRYSGEEIYDLCAGGSMELHKWTRAYKQALEDEGRADLFAAVLAFVSDLAWLHTKADRETYAAECIEHGVYLSDRWAERGFRCPG